MDILLDVSQLTVGDVEDIEEICGKQLDELDFKTPSAKLMKAIIYINGRRDNPDFTLEEARQVKLAEVKLVENPPTEDGGAS